MGPLGRNLVAVKRKLLTWKSPRENDQWGIDTARNNNVPYEFTFRELLDGKTFEEVLATRQRIGRTTHLLDLFGSGVVTPNLGFASSVTGVRLQDVPIENQSVRGLSHHSVIEGNLFSANTWDALSSSLRSRKIPGFDLITIRPVGGLKPMEMEFYRTGLQSKTNLAYHVLFYKIIQEAYSYLSREDGEMYIQLPTFEASIRTFTHHPWLNHLREMGVAITLKGGTLKIVKSANSPEKLPSPWRP